MLRIRNEQMRILAQPFVEQFADRVADHLCTEFPSRASALGRKGVEEIVRAGIAGATRVGIETEREIVLFVCLGVVAGLSFPDRPWAQPVLADTRLTSEQKLSRLYALARRNGHSVAASR